MKLPLRLRQFWADRRPRGERGATTVEFALVAPVFFFIVFAGIEMGFMFRANLSVEDMTRNATRVASIVRDDPDADQAILAEIDARTGSLNGEILSVVIFSANSLQDGMPAGCITPTGGLMDISGVCNSYSAAEVSSVASGSTPVRTAYDASTRNQWDVIGVAIRYRQDSVTGVIDGITFEATTVEVIELDL